MAWIPSYQSLSTHRKALRVAALLGIDRVQVIGHLHLLWWWAMDNVPPTGSLGHIGDAEIATAAAWNGDAAIFVQALTDAGFVDTNPRAREGAGAGLRARERKLHDWEEYGGKWQRKRVADRRRKRRGVPMDFQRNSSGVPSEVAGREEKRRVEENREEKKRNTLTPTPSPISFSPSSFTGQFVEFYEKDIGVLTPTIIECIKAIEAENPEMSPRWAMDAIAIACERGVRRWNYIEAILNGWLQNGQPPEDRENHA